MQLFTKLKMRTINFQSERKFTSRTLFLGYIQVKLGSKYTKKKRRTGYRQQWIQPGKAVSGSLRLTVGAERRSPDWSSTMEGTAKKLHREKGFNRTPDP